MARGERARKRWMYELELDDTQVRELGERLDAIGLVSEFETRPGGRCVYRLHFGFDESWIGWAGRRRVKLTMERLGQRFGATVTRAAYVPTLS